MVGRTAFQIILGVYDRQGPFEPFALRPMIAAQALMLALLVALAVALRHDPRSARWARLPLLMGLCSTGFLIVAKVPERGHDYYFWKTHLHAVLLMLPALAALSARLVGERRRLVLASVGIGATTAAICAALFFAFAPWRPTSPTPQSVSVFRATPG
jgi:peptidoglycan/LPS O-acetylase OafA/YrhL